jgi:hypothetical protein
MDPFLTPAAFRLAWMVRSVASTLRVSPGSIGVEKQRACRKWLQRPVSRFSAIAASRPIHCMIRGRSRPCSGCSGSRRTPRAIRNARPRGHS